jgi:hypothetical protein
MKLCTLFSSVPCYMPCQSQSFFDLMILTTFSVGYNLWSSSVSSFLNPLVTSSLLCPITFLSTPLSKSLADFLLSDVRETN